MKIHPQLQADCHKFGHFDVCTVLLNRNAALPWFILVPDTGAEDLLDLPPALLNRVTGECQRISRFLKLSLGFAKINFAGLGNVVPQMHLHIIARSSDDDCWPQPVWGNLTAGGDYRDETLAHWTSTLIADYGMVSEPHGG